MVVRLLCRDAIRCTAKQRTVSDSLSWRPLDSRICHFEHDVDELLLLMSGIVRVPIPIVCGHLHKLRPSSGPHIRKKF